MQASSSDSSTPTSSAPSVIPVSVSPWTESDQRRLDGGRRLCLILGIACVLLMAVPIGHWQTGEQGGGFPVFRWPGHCKLHFNNSWFNVHGWTFEVFLVLLLPALGGGLAVLAAFRKPWSRGLLALVAGLLLYAAGPVVSEFSYGYVRIKTDFGGFNSMFTVGPLALSATQRIVFVMVLLTALAAGGFHAAMRGGRSPLIRITALLPSLLALPPLLFLAHEVTHIPSELWTRHLATLDIGQFGGGLLQLVADYSAVAVVFLMLCSALLAIINAVMGNRAVACGGFVLTMLVFLSLGVFLGIHAVPTCLGATKSLGVFAVSIAVHNLLPFVAGIVLLISGYSRMWLWLVSRTVEAPVRVAEPERR